MMTVTPDPQDLIDLSDDALQGRDNNTPGSLLAQGILIRELTEMGATGLNTAQTGDDAFKQPFVRSGQSGVTFSPSSPAASCRTVRHGRRPLRPPVHLSPVRPATRPAMAHRQRRRRDRGTRDGRGITALPTSRAVRSSSPLG
jgi:hypothetical protein